MKKNAFGKSVLTFPYKSFTAECGKSIELWETGPSTVKSFSAYYEALWEKHKEEIIKTKYDSEIDVRYLAFVPLKIIDRLNSKSEYLQKYVRFFLGQMDEKPKYPLVDMYEVDNFERVLLEDISCLKGTFWFMAEGKLRTRQNPREGCYDNEETFIGELDFAFVQYMRQYELMGDDAVWNLTFKLRKIWRDLIWAMLDIVFDRVESEAPFDAIHANLRAAFQELPQALYRLECRRYQEISKETGTSVYRPAEKKDLTCDGYTSRDRKRDNRTHEMVRRMCDGAVTGKMDSRKPEERKWIDKAVRFYILRHDIENKPGASFAVACRHYWKDAEPHFKDLKQYENAGNYDYRHFYDIEAEKAKINNGTVSVP